MPTPPNVPTQESKRVVCGVLAIIFGGLPIYRFLLGDVTGGLIRILLCFNLGGILGLIEGIIYLTKSDADFIETYQVQKKAWF